MVAINMEHDHRGGGAATTGRCQKLTMKVELKVGNGIRTSKSL